MKDDAGSTAAAAPSGAVTLHISCNDPITLHPVIAEIPTLPLSSALHAPTHRYTLVLDLDNTLVSTTVLDVESATVLMTLRPYLNHLLAVATAHCDVVVWTAGRRHYAEHAVQGIVDHFKLPRAPVVISRDDANWYTEMDTVKDLRLLGRDMDRVLLIEDSVQYARMACDNALIVPYFRGSGDDNALFTLTRLLAQLIVSEAECVTPMLQKLCAPPLSIPVPYIAAAEYTYDDPEYAAADQAACPMVCDAALITGPTNISPPFAVARKGMQHHAAARRPQVIAPKKLAGSRKRRNSRDMHAVP